MSSSFGASNSANASSSSLARQRHQAPPKVETTLSSTSVASDRAVQLLCQFLESEKSKLSHLDLQQHWVDLHGVATTLCQNEKRYAKHRQDGEGSEKDSSLHRCNRRLEQMLADVEELGAGGGHGSAVAPLSSTAAAARHVVFDDDDEMDGSHSDDNNINDDDSRETKKAKKERKKEAKKAAKRERKEAKKKLKKEARSSAK